MGNIEPDILQHPIPGWNYETFREYALALGKGREYLLPIAEYPSTIELSEPWNEEFNKIRSKAYESWILIGFQEGQRRLILPRAAEKGLSHSVPYEVMEAGLNKARIKAGITDLVGDAHSHPRKFRDLNWHILSAENRKVEGAFSLGDMHAFLDDLNLQNPSDSKRSIMFVMEGSETIAAFATRESLESVRNNHLSSYEDFAKEWYRRYGWEFKGKSSNSMGGGEMVELIKPDASNLWQINKGVAHSYQIVLYRGFQDRPLIRDYPARITI